MRSVFTDRLVELIEGKVAWIVAACGSLRPLLLSQDLLLELKLLLHLGYMCQLLNHLLVLHLVAVVPLLRLATFGRALLVH